MSIEDINFLKNNSIRQSYTFLVDSKSRDRSVFPYPNNYVIDFSVPFKYVIGLELIDVSIPKTMYNIDYNNNKLYYYYGEEVPTVFNSITSNIEYDKSVFQLFEMPVGDYTTNTFINKIKTLFNNLNITDLDINPVDTPAELTNLIYFTCKRPFVLDMNRSTMAEVLGFDLYTSENNNGKYTFKPYNKIAGYEKLYHSVSQSNILHTIYSPGMMYLISYKYLILRCPEIEEHLYRSLSYSKYNLGLAKIRINSYGYNDEKTSFMKVPLREFHPIGKLPKMTFKFETETGELYDFKGVNHNMVFAIYYYEPKNENIVKKSILNPDYNPNYIEYIKSQEEQEINSDDEEDEYSRDDISQYMRNQLNFSKEGINNNNNSIIYKKTNNINSDNSSYYDTESD